MFKMSSNSGYYPHQPFRVKRGFVFQDGSIRSEDIEMAHSIPWRLE
jgi:hypothetical protein